MRNVTVSVAVPILSILCACSSKPDEQAGPANLTALPIIASTGSGEAHLAYAEETGAVLSWQEFDEPDYLLRFSRFDDGQWTPPSTIARGDDWFINWADFPSVVPISADTWIAHWLVNKPDNFGAYDIVTAISADAGTTWAAPTTLNADDTATEHGFVTLFSWDGDIGAVWLDGRNLVDWSIEEPLRDGVPLGVSLRYARMSNDGRVLERAEIDELVCDCCQPDVAVTSQGPIVTYRDRTADEIRDIVVRRLDGARWLEPVGLGPDNWEIAGCPVNGPAIAASGNEVAVAWFTAADNEPRVRFARSTDSGVSFGAAIDVDAEGAFGHADVAMVDDGAAVVSWWRRHEGGDIALAARRIEADGSFGDIRVVAVNDVAQPLDVPQMISTGSGLIFAWTSLAESYGVRTAYAENWP